MSFETQVWAKRQRTGSVGRKAVLMALAEYADEEHATKVPLRTIAEDTEQSLRTVQRALRDLEAADLIDRRPRFIEDESGARTTDVIILAAPPDNMSPGGDTGDANDTMSPGVATVTPISRERDLSLGATAPDADPDTTHQLPPPLTKVLADIDYPIPFQKTWAVYPKERRREKRGTYRAWRATVKRMVDGEKIDAHAAMLRLYHATEHYTEAMARKVADGGSWDYVKLSVTFYGPGEPWRDWITKPTNRPTLKEWEA